MELDSYRVCLVRAYCSLKCNARTRWRSPDVRAAPSGSCPTTFGVRKSKRRVARTTDFRPWFHRFVGPRCTLVVYDGGWFPVWLIHYRKCLMSYVRITNSSRWIVTDQKRTCCCCCCCTTVMNGYVPVEIKFYFHDRYLTAKRLRTREGGNETILPQAPGLGKLKRNPHKVQIV